MSKDEASQEEEVVPSPAALIESLRAFGYSPATSIADLIDNSITAGASRIDVNFGWAGPDSHVSVFDNGKGMNEADLRDAMRPGSSNPRDARESDDLGRFGLGLKTASFSQARVLTVVSIVKGKKPALRRWDLDHVGATNRWSLLSSSPPNFEHLAVLPEDASHGTLVLWTAMDRLVDSRPDSDRGDSGAFFATVAEVRAHLEMVFHRFISEDGLEIRVNDQLCVAWDPFLTDNKHTEKQPSEDRKLTAPDGTIQKLIIQPYVLPHRSKLSAEEHRSAAGPRGWNLQQGFYLYRSRRLIVAGDWFNSSTKPEEHHKLARIRVELTSEMDGAWDLDVRKSRARPPALLRDDFRRIASATRKKAEEVYRQRGKRSVGQGTRTPIVPVWLADSSGGSVNYQVNREHELPKRLKASLTPAQAKNLEAAFALLERHLPIGHILNQGFSDEKSLGEEQDELPAEVRRSLQEIFAALCREGNSESEARQILSTHSPFDRYPELVDALELEKP